MGYACSPNARNGAAIWPVTREGKCTLTPAQLSMLLEDRVATSQTDRTAASGYNPLQSEYMDTPLMRIPLRAPLQNATGHHPPDGIQPPALTEGGGLCSEINRLKALVAGTANVCISVKAQKLRAKPNDRYRKHRRESAHQEEMAETLGEQYDPVLPSAALRQSSACKQLPASLPRETGLSGQKRLLSNLVVNSVLWDVMCQSSWSLSAAPLRLSKHKSETGPVVGVTISLQALLMSTTDEK